VLESEWDCTLEPRSGAETQLRASDFARHSSFVTGHPAQPALRLGLRMVKGLSQQGAQRLIAARSLLFSPPLSPPRAAGVAPDFEHLALRANLSRKDMNALAAAGALESLSGHRRAAAWLVAGIEQRPPLLAAAAITESGVVLAPPAEGDDILADYASTGLTLRRHPLALLRPRLNQLAMRTAEELKTTPSGTPVKVAGLVTCRQHPGTAKGVIFVTLEDETGQINVVVWESLSRRQRRPLLTSRLLRVAGTLERDGAVIHVIARDLADYSRLIGRLDARSRDFH
jgi:error-prone DNA polymerase